MKELEIYNTKDGETRIEVHINEETVWLAQAQRVELFQSSKANISEHVKMGFNCSEIPNS